MAGRLTAAAAVCVRGGRKCRHRPIPVCSKVHLCSLPDTQQLQIQDDFFTHLHAKGQEMEGRLSLLLLLSAQWSDETSMHRLLQQGRSAGVRPSTYTMEKVLNSYIRRKHLKAAVSLYGSIKTEYSEAPLKSSTVLHFCTMLVENGQCLEALQTLREFVEAGKKPQLSAKNVTESCKVLLSKTTETGSYEATKEMFDLLVLGRLVDPGPQVVTPLLQCKLDRDDLQGTVEVAEYIYNSFNTLPKRMEILIRLMQHSPPLEDTLLSVMRRHGTQTRQETDLLGRMFDLVQSCYGPTQAHHDLFFVCLETGCPAAARVVLQTLASDVDSRQLLRMCKLYAKNEREAALEHLLTASKGMANIDRPKIYEILLDSYVLSSRKVGDKGLSLWMSMQEEGLTPSSTFLSTLATLLQKCNMKVPFQVK